MEVVEPWPFHELGINTLSSALLAMPTPRLFVVTFHLVTKSI